MIDKDVYLLGGSPVSLKPGKMHCLYCSGYGYNPRNRREMLTGPKAVRCYRCDGSGLRDSFDYLQYQGWIP